MTHVRGCRPGYSLLPGILRTERNCWALRGEKDSLPCSRFRNGTGPRGRSCFFDVGNMKDLFDSVTPSTILLYVRAIGLFSRCDLTSYLGRCTHLTITFISSGLCLDSWGSLHLFWHCMALLVLMCR